MEDGKRDFSDLLGGSGKGAGDLKLDFSDLLKGSSGGLLDKVDATVAPATKPADPTDDATKPAEGGELVPATKPAEGGELVPAMPSSGAGGTTEESEEEEHYMAQGDMRQAMLFSFMQGLGNFLRASSTLFQNCPVLRELAEEYTNRTVLDEEKYKTEEEQKELADLERARRKYTHDIIMEWNKAFKPYYEAIQERDADSLFEGSLPKHPMFEKIRIAKKWPLLVPGVRESIFQHLHKLCEYANVYVVFQDCPDGMFNVVTGIAQNFAAKMQSGEMNLADLQKTNLEKLGKGVLDKTSKKDQAAFAKILNNQDKMDSMMEIIMSMLGDSLGPSIMSQLTKARMMRRK